MKQLTHIILLAFFLIEPLSISAQINLCKTKEMDIKDRATEIVREYINLIAIDDKDKKQEIKNISNVLYNSVEDFYYVNISTLREIERVTDEESMRVTKAKEDAELHYIVKIERIDKLIPDLKFQTIGNKEQISALPGQEVNVIECPESSRSLQIEMASGTVIKKGQDIPIEWDGGTIEDTLALDLVKFDKNGSIKDTYNIAFNYLNKGYYTDWNYQNKLKPGIYKIRIQKVNSKEPPIWSEEFRIKSKFPMVAKIGIPVAVGVVVYLLIRNPPEPEQLPEPPLPPLFN